MTLKKKILLRKIKNFTINFGLPHPAAHNVLYLSEPASITMENMLISDQHLLFLLTVIVLFVAFLPYILNYFQNKFSTKFVRFKESKILELNSLFKKKITKKKKKT